MAMMKTSKIKVSNFKLRLNDSDTEFILRQISEVLASHRWTVGPKGEAFEKVFREYTGASHAVALANAGFALVAILKALEIPQGSIILCPTLTAPPTPHAILASNMKVLFADSDAHDLGLDPEDVKKKLKKYAGKIQAVIAVHVGGWISPQIKEIFRLCRESGIPLIEDCAHAHGSLLDGQPAGSTAGLAAYSFFMTKPLTSGEGGIVTGEDKNLIETIRSMRNYGKDGHGKHVREGFNYKLSEFNAVVALWATLQAPRLIRERREIAAHYDQQLKQTEELDIVSVPGCDCSYYKYIVTVKRGMDRDRIKNVLLEEYGIEPSGGVYDTLCHEEPFFRSCPDVLNAAESFPQAEDFSRRQICLPLYPGLSLGEQKLVTESLLRTISHA